MRAKHDAGGGVFVDPLKLLKSAGLERDADRLRSLQARSMAAYEAGRFAEGGRLAAKADTLLDRIESVLEALEEEGEGQQEPVIQSLTRAMAEAWDDCVRGGECREQVLAYQRTGHGDWQEPTLDFIGPTGMWGRSSPEEHPEWFRLTPGYYLDPHLVHRLRDLVGDHDANGSLLLDAAEDAWNALHATAQRIRAGAQVRRERRVSPVAEAKKFVRRITRRKKTSRRP